MSAVPLEVIQEAAAHLAKLGMQHELEQMLDWVRRHVALLREIRVTVARHFASSKVPPWLVIWASQAMPAEKAPVDLIE